MKNYLDIIAYAAAFCTTIAFLPQAILVYRTRNTVSISFLMYTTFIIGLILWGAYGILTHQLPIILANAITLILALAIWVIKVYDMRRKDKNTI